VLQQMRGSAKYIWFAIFIVFVGSFLLYQTSGLSGNTNNTASTVVASINGQDIVLQQWQTDVQRREQEAQQRLGRSLSLDEQRKVEQQTFDELVQSILLEQEYKKRGIRVSDAEIVDAAYTSPPQEFQRLPDLQTDGHFDQDKYERYLSSPMAKQSGLLAGLENMYRTQIPREKLFGQIASSVYVSDAQLWSLWRDNRDSAQISFAAWAPDAVPDSVIHVSDEAIRSYYDTHKKDLTRKGRAVLSLMIIPRAIGPADSAAARAHLLALRDEIAKGAKFEDVAKRESADSASAANGGLLGTVAKGRFVPSFDSAAFALKTGELSGPVLSPYGYHLIRVDARKGDSITVRHILVRIEQSDSSAARTNNRADSLEKLAAQAETPAAFDQAAKSLGLAVLRATVVEDQPALVAGREIPSVGTWAFSGSAVGQSSDLFDDDNGYYLARLDSLNPGGVPTLAQATPQIRQILARTVALDVLRPKALVFAGTAANTSLEQASAALHTPVEKSPEFTRTSVVPDVGRMNEVIGAAFTLPVGAVSQPIQTPEAIYVIRVDKRVKADSAVWAAQKPQQRQQVLQALQQQAVQNFMSDLRDAAKIKDNRKAIDAANRRSGAAT
jgi:peptidyl-prolyl cis-trans isomerase D